MAGRQAVPVASLQQRGQRGQGFGECCGDLTACRLSATTHVEKNDRDRFRMTRPAVIEIPHGLIRLLGLNVGVKRRNLRLPASLQASAGSTVRPCSGTQREQSVASRLERHPTPSAKTDGKCITPAVNPDRFSLSGFLVSGCRHFVCWFVPWTGFGLRRHLRHGR